MNDHLSSSLVRGVLRWGIRLCFLLTLILAGGCAGEELLTPPEEPEEPEAEPLFARYVALGSDLTAGVQADGINRATQSESYAALVAQAMGTEFNAPLIEMPGCPPPITDAFTGERLGEGSCSGLVETVPSVLHNVAVPGARIGDLLRLPGEEVPENPMNTLMLGGKTQLEALAEVKPTFVSVWFGTERLMEYMRIGEDTGADYPWGPGWSIRSSYLRSLLDSLEARGVRGGVVIGVPFLHAYLPYWSTGPAYVEAKEQGLLPATFGVDSSCEDRFRGGYLVPFSYGFGELMTRARAGEEVVLDCANDARVFSPLAWEMVVNRQPSINEQTADAVRERGWAYMGLDPFGFDAFSDPDLCTVPDFPNLPGSSEPPFGGCISLDGLRPSPLSHEIIANRVLEAINETYDTSFTLK